MGKALGVVPQVRALRDVKDGRIGTPVEMSLAQFVKESWAVLEPSTELIWGWHMEAICQHVEALLMDWLGKKYDPEFLQRMQNLIINVPPGSAKSRIVSVCAPAWMWTKCPEWRGIFLSANPRVALRDSVLCRDLIESEWYQEQFKPRWKLRADQNLKSSFWNTVGGFRSAAGMESRITGDRADGLFFDDPHDAEEVFSDQKRRSIIERWVNAISNRVNDLRISVRCGIMQRLHSEDLADHCIKKGWHKLVIPQEYEGDDSVSGIGWEDPREEIGELMDPIRFPMATLDEEKEKGSYYYAGQHQQRPAPLEGGMIKRQWINRYTIPPRDYVRCIVSLDTAAKAKEINDPWAWTVWLETKKDTYYLVDSLTKRCEYVEGKDITISLCSKWKPDALLIEDKSTGQALLPDLKETHARFNPIAILPEADKITRMMVHTPAFESGRVYLPEEAAWLYDYETPLFSFPNSAVKDPVDSTSQFLKWVKKSKEAPVEPATAGQSLKTPWKTDGKFKGKIF